MICSRDKVRTQLELLAVDIDILSPNNALMMGNLSPDSDTKRDF